MRQLLLLVFWVFGNAASIAAPADWFSSLPPERRLDLQAGLTLVGHYDGLIDGIYGPSTDRAIRTFELHEGEVPDGQLSNDELDDLAREAGEVFARLGLVHVYDDRTGLSPFIAKALLTVTQQTDSGTMYSTADKGLSFETIRAHRRAGVTFADVLRSLQHYGDGSHVTYSKVTASTLVAAGAAPNFSYYLRMANDGGYVTGYRVVWTANYADEGSLLSTFAFSPASPRARPAAPTPDDRPSLIATNAGEQIGSFLLPQDQPDVVVLEGDITSNTALDFIRALKTRPTTKTVLLNSNGGLVTQGLLVAHELHARGLRTEVSPSMGCYSACAYIFFAGVQRIDQGALGVHQIYGDGLNAENAQMSLSDVLDALKDFGVSQDVVSIMLRTPPEQMHVFTRDEIASLSINKTQFPTSDDTNAPSTAEQAVAAIDPASVAGSQSLLLEAQDNGTTGAVPFSGTVDWTKGTDENGQLTLVGKAYIPARNLAVDVLIRKNSDPSLPASHLMEFNFTVSDSFVGGSIAGLPGVLLKDEELTQGTPLVGASARVVGNSFLFALSAAPEDSKANVNLLTGRKWIDLALIYASGKRAIITLEKDDKAQRLFYSFFSDAAANPASSTPPSLTEQSLMAFIAREADARTSRANTGG